MTDQADNARVLIPPPLAWALAAALGFALDWLWPAPFVPAATPRGWIAGGLFAVGFALALWAVAVMRQAGTRVEPNKPTTAIVAHGPYRFTRNPIYLGLLLWLAAVAIGFDRLWVLAMLLPLYLVLRYGVIAREEAYLTAKFGPTYRAYQARVRRWL